MASEQAWRAYRMWSYDTIHKQRFHHMRTVAEYLHTNWQQVPNDITSADGLCEAYSHLADYLLEKFGMPSFSCRTCTWRTSPDAHPITPDEPALHRRSLWRERFHRKWTV